MCSVKPRTCKFDNLIFEGTRLQTTEDEMVMDINRIQPCIPQPANKSGSSWYLVKRLLRRPIRIVESKWNTNQSSVLRAVSQHLQRHLGLRRKPRKLVVSLSHSSHSFASFDLPLSHRLYSYSARSSFKTRASLCPLEYLTRS